MRNIVARRGMIALAGLFTVLFAVTGFSQLALRKAMDTDLDGKADFTVVRPATNTWWVAKSGGGFTSTLFGLNGEDFYTPGDYDGDNKGDLAVWRDTTGVFWVL